MTLRPYQDKSAHAIRVAFVGGVKRLVYCAPTGSGKTVTFAYIASRAAARGVRVGILVHRAELIDQAADKLMLYGVKRQEMTIVQGSKRRNAFARITIASVQTLRNRDPLWDSSVEPTLWIIDEAHRQEFDKVFSRPEFTHANVIAATATPLRRGRQTQLGDIYEELIEPVTISELISQGYLAMPTYVLPKAQVETSGIEIDIKTGDFKPGDNFKAFDKAEVYDGIIDGFVHSGARRAICFCANIEHSKLTAEQFKARGYNAAFLHGNMSKSVRSDIIKRYKAGQLHVLTNCDILTTGFDDPATDTVILNRATASIPLYLQMVGRGSRITKDKARFNIIDAGTNRKRLGAWEQERNYSLWHKTPKRKGVAPTKECPSCMRFLPTSMMKCNYCGHEFEQASREVLKSEGWETIGFEEVMRLTSLQSTAKSGSASLDELVELWTTKQVRKPFTLMGYLWKAVESEQPAVIAQKFSELCDRCGWKNGIVKRYAGFKNINITLP